MLPNPDHTVAAIDVFLYLAGTGILLFGIAAIVKLFKP